MFYVIQEVISDVETTKNVIEATNRPNLYERLDAIQGQLTLCEKALAEYLETKRLAFPRFYFVSSVDLIDILSSGNSPTLVSHVLLFVIVVIVALCRPLVHNKMRGMWRFLVFPRSTI